MVLAIQETLRQPGRLVSTPTDLSLAFPHGGTALGKLISVAIDWGIDAIDVPGLEDGEPVDQIELIGVFTMSCVLRGYDNEVVKVAMPNTVVSSTGNRRIQGRGAKRHGRMRSSRAVPILFSPDDPDHRAVYIPLALPAPDVTQALFLMGSARYGFPLVFTAMEDSNGETYYVDLLGDLDTDIVL